MSARITCTSLGVVGAIAVISQMAAVAFAGGEADPSDSVVIGRDHPIQPIGGNQVDIGVSRIGLESTSPNDDFHYWGSSGGIRAFSIASTACNFANVEAQWIQGSAGNHPVISQNMFRLLDGRFEHIGQSWLKHSFCAVSESTCGPCTPNATCDYLAEHCADTYWATLNDGQGGGPKSQINPVGFGPGGTHNNHSWASPSGPAEIRGRLQISDADINAGGQNFAEIHYITHDEPLPNRHNNASWREVDLSLTSISGVGVGQSSVRQQQVALFAWKHEDAGVTIFAATDEQGGRFYLGYRVTDNGDGTWHYEYALQNMNSDRAARLFSVPIPAGANLTNIGFHDVDYHSGEPYDGTDWSVSIGDGSVDWSTQDFLTNANANALRWGTLYNFRFDADTPPTAVSVEIGLFKPGVGDSLFSSAEGPSPPDPGKCPQDINGDGSIDVLDLIDLLLCFGSPAVPGCENEDITGDGTVNVLDLLDLLLGFGTACP